MPPALHTESLVHAAAGRTYEAWVAAPERSGPPRPCVLLTHDWSGLHDGIRRIAERIAGLGHVCVALDLYGRGVRGEPTGDNSRLMDPLLADRAELRRRLLAGLDAAVAWPGVDATRLAVVGYCFGGLCALDLARASPPGLVATVSVHGVLTPPGLGPQPPITSRVLVLHGWEDPVAPPSAVLGIAEELTAAGADWQLHAYGHARHAFTFEGASAPERGIEHHPLAARRAWGAMVGFLGEQLGDAEP